MKELKQRFSIWYNRTHQRYGTLWAERFKSVLMEDAATCLSAVSAYIDLNPVRAGLVEDPKDYRYCGYSEAVAGNIKARGGLCRALAMKTGKAALSEYRKILFLMGATTSRAKPESYGPRSGQKSGGSGWNPAFGAGIEAAGTVFYRWHGSGLERLRERDIRNASRAIWKTPEFGCSPHAWPEGFGVDGDA